jgi:hypothetical protein
MYDGHVRVSEAPWLLVTVIGYIYNEEDRKKQEKYLKPRGSSKGLLYEPPGNIFSRVRKKMASK